MQARIYLRIGKSERGRKPKVAVSNRPSYASLYDDPPKNSKPIPTLLIALDVNIDDKEFDAAKIVIETKISSPKAAVEIVQAQRYPEKPQQADDPNVEINRIGKESAS